MAVSEASGSRERLIRATVTLISAKGYENTGIQEILETAGVSKSNFYYHFKSKEALCLEALETIAEKFRNDIVTPTLENETLPPRERFERFFGALEAIMAEKECSGGCPIVNLATETSDFYPAFRERIQEFLTELSRAIESAYRAGMDRDDFRKDIEPAVMAGMILSAANGTMVQAKAMKSLDVIRNNREAMLRLMAGQA